MLWNVVGDAKAQLPMHNTNNGSQSDRLDIKDHGLRNLNQQPPKNQKFQNRIHQNHQNHQNHQRQHQKTNFQAHVMTKGDTLLKRALKEMEKDKPDKEKAFAHLNESAIENNYEAMYALGTWYLHGIYVRKNKSMAVDYFVKSIVGNNKNAFYDLAVCYEKGTGIKMNKKKAFECYLNAALLGEKQSLYEVGRCYYHGIGISKNETIGLIWIKQAKLNGIVI